MEKLVNCYCDILKKIPETLSPLLLCMPQHPREFHIARGGKTFMVASK
jgi:hypothetical protein